MAKEEGGEEEEVGPKRPSEVSLEGGAASSRDRDETEEVIVNGEEEGGQEEEVVQDKSGRGRCQLLAHVSCCKCRPPGATGAPAAGPQTALTTLPPRRQRVQTRTRLARPFTTARIDTRLGSHRSRGDVVRMADLIALRPDPSHRHHNAGPCSWTPRERWDSRQLRRAPERGRLAAEQCTSIPWGPR